MSLEPDNFDQSALPIHVEFELVTIFSSIDRMTRDQLVDFCKVIVRQNKVQHHLYLQMIAQKWFNPPDFREEKSDSPE